MRKITPLFILSGIVCALPLTAQTIFQDNFDTSLSSGVETDVNFEINDGRQSGGTTGSTYTEQALTGSGGFLNVMNPNLLTDGNLLLRTNYNSTTARSSGVILDTNFGPQLAGQKYEITFDGLISPTAGASTDLWMSFYVFDTVFDPNTAAAPSAGGTDLGFTLRPNGRATIFEEGVIAQNYTVDGTTTITANEVFNLSLVIDETLATPEATLTIGSTVLGTFEIDFETTDRFFGMRANQGTVNGTVGGALVDFRYDNLNISIIPEPGTYALLAGLGMLTLASLRRRL